MRSDKLQLTFSGEKPLKWCYDARGGEALARLIGRARGSGVKPKELCLEVRNWQLSRQPKLFIH